MTTDFNAGDACLISCRGPFDGMVVVLERRSPGCSALWKIAGRAQDKAGQSIGLVHDSWLIPLGESAGVDEIILVRMSRLGSDLAGRMLAQRKAERARI